MKRVGSDHPRGITALKLLRVDQAGGIRLEV